MGSNHVKLYENLISGSGGDVVDRCMREGRPMDKYRSQ